MRNHLSASWGYETFSNLFINLIYWTVINVNKLRRWMLVNQMYIDTMWHFQWVLILDISQKALWALIFYNWHNCQEECNSPWQLLLVSWIRHILKPFRNTGGIIHLILMYHISTLISFLKFTDKWHQVFRDDSYVYYTLLWYTLISS